jgi:hypothetical protein
MKPCISRHVSEYVPARFGLVDTKLSSQRARSIHIHGTTLLCRAQPHYLHAWLFPEQEQDTWHIENNNTPI